jgi:hypothetical protein
MNKKIYSAYLNNLKKRFLSCAPNLISEDCIRYDFFVALNSNDKLSTNDIILEYPLSSAMNENHGQSKIDCVVEKLKLCCEFKFWKDSNTASPSTMNAGELFKDIYRLSNLKNYKYRFAIIVSCSRMIDYLKNKCYLDIERDSFSIKSKDLVGMPKTFIEAAGFNKTIPRDLSFKKIFYDKIDRNFSVLILNVS